MNKLASHKLVEVYEELMEIKQQGNLSFVGERELIVCKLLLFGR